MLNKFGLVLENASLENYNSYGIKTSTKYLVIPDSIDNLQELIKYLNKENIEYYILGKGTNVILPDKKFNGVIISLEKLNNIKIENNYITAECGTLLLKLAMTSIENNLKGLESLASIPGTLGGALYGNAGANGSTIYDHLESVLVIRNNKLISLKNEEINKSYRYTEFKENKDVLVKATFKLENYSNKEELLNIVKENRENRMNTQPLEYKNAGSVFKNPPNDYAGRLIESVGLKGFSVNDAMVSLKHANFIINKGKATSEDIKKLIQIIKEKVYKEYKIDLKLEQIIIEWN